MRLVYEPVADSGVCREWWGSAGRPLCSGGSGAVDLEEVEGGGGEVGFAGDCFEAAAGEPVEQFLEVPDGGFDGGAAAGVELCALGGAEPVLHRLAWAGVSGWGSGRGVVAGGLADRAGLAGGDEPVGAVGGEGGVAAVAGIEQQGAQLGGGAQGGGGGGDRVDHGDVAGDVGGVGTDLQSDDDLVGGHRELGVVALYPPVAGGHDRGVGVGEVAPGAGSVVGVGDSPPRGLDPGHRPAHHHGLFGGFGGCPAGRRRTGDSHGLLPLPLPCLPLDLASGELGGQRRFGGG